MNKWKIFVFVLFFSQQTSAFAWRRELSNLLPKLTVLAQKIRLISSAPQYKEVEQPVKQWLDQVASMHSSTEKMNVAYVINPVENSTQIELNNGHNNQFVVHIEAAFYDNLLRCLEDNSHTVEFPINSHKKVKTNCDNFFMMMIGTAAHELGGHGCNHEKHSSLCLSLRERELEADKAAIQFSGGRVGMMALLKIDHMKAIEQYKRNSDLFLYSLGNYKTIEEFMEKDPVRALRCYIRNEDGASKFITSHYPTPYERYLHLKNQSRHTPTRFGVIETTDANGKVTIEDFIV